MKREILLPFLILLFFSTTSNASHYHGGEMFYEYIGDTSGIPNQYMVYVKLFRDYHHSAQLPSSISLKINSNCGPTSSVSMARYIPLGETNAGDGGYFPRIEECVSLSSGSIYKVSIHQYKKVIVLPGNCVHNLSVDITGRTFSSNLNPYFGNLYLETLLTNTLGNNNSPRFEQAPQVYQCLNQNVYSNFSAVEKDGDSLYYKLVEPETSGGVKYSYQSGYSVHQPVNTVNGVFLDSLSGLLSYVPNTQQNAVVKVLVMEYRYDSVNSVWTIIGDTSRDIIFKVGPSCSSVASDFYMEKDSLGFDTAATVYCTDSIVRFKTRQPFLISSLAIDGSDFEIVGDSSIKYPITQASFFDTINSVYAKGVRLQLQNKIHKDDTLMVQSKIGSDQNSLINHCGYEMNAGDSLMVLAMDTCEEVNTSALFEIDRMDQFELFPNPANNLITIKVQQGLQIQEIVLLSIDGQMLFKYDQVRLTETALDISGIENGCYIIQLKNQEGGMSSQLLLKE